MRQEINKLNNMLSQHRAIAGQSKTPYSKQPDRAGLWKGFPQHWMRSIYLPIPAPAGHPLRAFGQGDHAYLDDDHQQANMLQLLEQLGGAIDPFIDHPQAVWQKVWQAVGHDVGPEVIKATPKVEEPQMVPHNRKITRLMQAVLMRHPTEEEYQHIQHFLKHQPPSEADLRDILWSLLAGREWLFIP